MTSTGTFAGVFPDHWMPHAPLASDAKDGSYKRMSREQALTLSHIEANPLALQSLVIVDHDGADAEHIAALVGLPAPSYVAMNPHTNAGHIVYGLAFPVCLTDAANRRPVNLLARIEQGLTTVLGGDVGYGGRITKNPYHQDHLPLWGAQNAVYGLRELAKSLGDLGALPGSDEKRILASSAVGRNVALFDVTRQWAYRRRIDYTDSRDWEETVQAFAWMKNLSVISDTFSRGPMDQIEVTHLARSIARWTWRNMSPERTAQNRQRWAEPAKQSYRRQLGLAKQKAEGLSDAQREANRVRRTKVSYEEIIRIIT